MISYSLKFSRLRIQLKIKMLAAKILLAGPYQ
jgi:hypothetical protein